MNSHEINLPYSPNIKEVQRGMRLACKPVYSGIWFLGKMIFNIVQGLSIGLLFYGILYLVFQSSDVMRQTSPLSSWVLMILMAVPYIALIRALRRRAAAQYLEGNSLENQQLKIDNSGIAFFNDRSRSFYDWRDIDTIVESKDMLVPVRAANGLVLPNRILQLAGEIDTVRAQIKNWHHSARAAP